MARSLSSAISFRWPITSTFNHCIHYTVAKGSAELVYSLAIRFRHT
jgi:hypothetical protein